MTASIALDHVNKEYLSSLIYQCLFARLFREWVEQTISYIGSFCCRRNEKRRTLNILFSCLFVQAILIPFLNTLFTSLFVSSDVVLVLLNWVHIFPSISFPLSTYIFLSLFYSFYFTLSHSFWSVLKCKTKNNTILVCVIKNRIINVCQWKVSLNIATQPEPETALKWFRVSYDCSRLSSCFFSQLENSHTFSFSFEMVINDQQTADSPSHETKEKWQFSISFWPCREKKRFMVLSHFERNGEMLFVT